MQLIFLIVGLGSMGKRRIRNLNANEEKNIIGFDIRIDRRKEAEKKYNIQTIDDFKLLSQDDFDVLIISTSPEAHGDYIRFALNHKKHFFVEHPTSDDGYVDIFKHNHLDIVKAPSCTLLFYEPLKMVKKLLDEDAIGKILAFQYHMGQYLPDWHPWEDYKKAYAARSEMGGGVVLTMCHELNYLTFLFGKAIQCKALEFKKKTLNITAEEGINILLEHETGVHSNVHLNYVQKPDRRSLDIIGEKGSLYWEPGNNEIIFDDGKNKEIYTFENNRMGTPYEQSFYNQMEHFVAMAQKKVKSKVPLTKGIEDLELCTTILKEIGR